MIQWTKLWTWRIRQVFIGWRYGAPLSLKYLSRTYPMSEDDKKQLDETLADVHQYDDAISQEYNIKPPSD